MIRGRIFRWLVAGVVFGVTAAAGSPSGVVGAASSHASPTFQIVRDVPYIQPATPQRSGDLYLPHWDGSSLRPAVIVVHGGGWSGGSNMVPTVLFDSRTLAAHGYVAFDINYRLTGQGGVFPSDVQDVKDAIAFVAAHAARLHVDVHRLAVLGPSAGGHLSLMGAYTPDAGIFAAPHYPRSKAHVAAVASYYGPTDLATMQSIVPPQIKQILQRYVGAGFDQNPELYREASPVTYVGTAVPTLLLHGTGDRTVPFSQSVELSRLLHQDNVPVQLVPFPGAPHGFDSGPGSARTIAMNRVLAFFHKVLAAKPR